MTLPNPVYWIGGGSGAGKSTIAHRLAQAHDLAIYSTDDAIQAHVELSTPTTAPALHDFLAMSMDERWVRRDPAAMLETFHWFLGECFDFILEDLAALDSPGGVVVEGFRLLPSQVEPLLAEASRAVWLLPTPEFRRSAFVDRGSLWEIANWTSDPPVALANLLERDRLFTERIRSEVEHRRLPFIDIDTTINTVTATQRVSAVLGLV